MKRTKRVETTIETHQVLVVKSSPGTTDCFCPDCQLVVRAVVAGQAAAIAGVSERTVNRWVELGLIHFMETPAGQLLVCVPSLPAAA